MVFVTHNFLKTLSGWAVIERERFFDWLPVGMGFGIAAYFSLMEEPAAEMGLIAAFICLGLAALSWRWPRMRFVALTLLAVSTGFTSAQWRTHEVSAPQLERRLGSRDVTGTVIKTSLGDERQLKLLIKNPTISGLDADKTPAVLSLAVRTKGDKVDVGDVVRMRAILMPPSTPAIPGGFDYARQAFFAQIGGVGFAIGPISRVSGPRPRTNSLFTRWELPLENLRNTITQKFVTGLPGQEGAMAAAFVTGVRDGISKDVVLAMQNSGLAHLVAISGMNLSLVTGIVFFILRGAFALAPPLALNFPIKKLVAVVAGLIAFGYLMISGNDIPVQRAFLMTSMVLLAVIFDRNPISMRLLGLAAIFIFLVRPESLLSVSFQMSFAAVVALIAAYEALRGPLARWRAGRPGIIAKAFVYLSLICMTTIVAELAIGPIATYHFNRLVLYGLLANLLAEPIVAFWIMPWLVVAVALMPFNLESLAMPALRLGFDLMLSIAQHVAALPGVLLPVPGFSMAAFAVIMFGGLWLCLCATPLRYAGLGLVALGLIMATDRMSPDILVETQGKLMAVKEGDGRYSLSSLRSSSYSRDMWLRQNGQAEAIAWPKKPTDAKGGEAVSCLKKTCIYEPWKQGAVSEGKKPLIVLRWDKSYPEEACRNAAVIVSREPIKRRCPAPVLVIDRFDLFYYGSHAVWISQRPNGDWKFRVSTAAEQRGNRPWTNTPKPPSWRKNKYETSEFIWSPAPGSGSVTAQ